MARQGNRAARSCHSITFPAIKIWMHLSKMHISTGICRNSKAGIWTYSVVVGGAAESTNLAAPRRRDRSRARRMVPSFTPCGGKPYCCRHLASACVLLRAKSVQNPCQNLLTHTRRHTVFTVKETRFFAQGGLTAASAEPSRTGFCVWVWADFSGDGPR